MKKFGFGLLGMFSILAACAAPTSHETESTDQKQEGEPQSISVGSAVAPQAAVINNGYTEVSRGYISQLKNSPTYNEPTGQFVRVTVSNCLLQSISMSALDSNSQPITLFPAGVQPTPGGYIAYWELQSFENDYDLGYVTINAFGTGSCYAVVDQADGAGGGFRPPPPPPPPAPVSCFSLNEFACRSQPGCLALYSTGPLGFVRVYTGCQPTFFAH